MVYQHEPVRLTSKRAFLRESPPVQPPPPAMLSCHRVDRFRMPSRYSDHAFIGRIKDITSGDPDSTYVEVVTEGGAGQLYNPFVLKIWSPVIAACITNSGGKWMDRVVVDISAEVNRRTWEQLTCLASGDSIEVDEVGEQLLELAKAADYLQMKDIHEEVEGRLILKLTIATCARLLSGAADGGVPALLKACRSMALKGFVEFVGTRDFKRISSDVLMSLLEDDTLQSKDEVLFLSLSFP